MRGRGRWARAVSRFGAGGRRRGAATHTRGMGRALASYGAAGRAAARSTRGAASSREPHLGRAVVGVPHMRTRPWAGGARPGGSAARVETSSPPERGGAAHARVRRGTPHRWRDGHRWRRYARACGTQVDRGLDGVRHARACTSRSAHLGRAREPGEVPRSRGCLGGRRWRGALPWRRQAAGRRPRGLCQGTDRSAAADAAREVTYACPYALGYRPRGRRPGEGPAAVRRSGARSDVRLPSGTATPQAAPAGPLPGDQPPAGPAVLAVPARASRSLLRTRMTNQAVARASTAIAAAGMKAVEMPWASTS